MMHYKDERLREEFARVPAILQVIVCEFIALANEYGIIPVMTRVLERIEGSSGVHEAGRAVDFRDEFPSGQFIFAPETRNKILATLNERYTRRDRKQTIIWHSFRGAPHHFHIQSPADVRTFIIQRVTANLIEETETSA